MDAIGCLEASGTQIALVTDASGVLLGTVTDGDIRRALLEGGALDAPIEPHVQKHFVSVSPAADRAEVLDLMQARAIHQIPVVDAQGKLVGLHLMEALIGTVERPNWAVLMAGGQGLRLRPLTETIPKPMIKVAGRPILERLVLHLVGYGIRRVFVAVNYLGDMIERHFGDGARFGCHIEYLRENTPLGTGGALSLLPARPTDPLLVLNGDLVTQVNIDHLLRFHTDGGWKATMSLNDYSHTIPYGVVDMEGMAVRGLQEKPSLVFPTNAGVYVLDPDLPGRIPQGKTYSLPNIIEDCLARNEPVGGFSIEGDWIDVGRVAELRRARGDTEKP